MKNRGAGGAGGAEATASITHMLLQGVQGVQGYACFFLPTCTTLYIQVAAPC